MILGLAQSFPPDAAERQLPDVDSARALIGARRPAVLERIRARVASADGRGDVLSMRRFEDAIVLAVARFGVRHGSWGEDHHDYHNEDHALEILDGRVGRLMNGVGVQALPPTDWRMLMLFGACHDLRQRERVDFRHPIGNNEAASIAEATRIMVAAGFETARDDADFLAMELMIAGSTFDARPTPPPSEFNPAEVAATGGALAPKLPAILDREVPDWRKREHIGRALTLAMLASDLDTANVAESFVALAESAARLCREREAFAGRALDATESAGPCLDFLSRGQERYFFELHRFCSELGSRCFAAGKEANAARVSTVSARLRERFPAAGHDATTGAQVVAAFLELARSIDTHGATPAR
ncbi:MAG TPA: hypothetical protein VFG21_12155 [Xanthomonadaceae bacterium]|nr:hypothetical protein [Xanthomonadaceae bacterium]